MSQEISADVRALIGVKSVRRCLVTLRDIRRFAQAIGERDPIHFDEEYAKRTRYGAVVAPPLFCQSLTYADAFPEELGADGSPVELNIPIPAERAVGGGSDYVVNRLVRAGETITVTSELLDVRTKQGKSGVLYLVIVSTTFADQDGQLVAAETATYIKRV